MEILKGNKVKFKKLYDIYQITVDTMDNNGNHHSSNLIFPNTENGLSDMRESIISLECCSKKTLHDSDGYDNTPFFNKRLRLKWHFSNCVIDELISYKVRYYDENSILYKVDITNDEEMIKIITNY